MKKKYKLLSILMAATVAAGATLAGCSLVSADAEADMEQVIATVDISQSENFSRFNKDLEPYTGAISSGTDILKRDLVAYFLNAGGSLIQSGSTYGQAFQTLSETLVNNEILIQYATLATLKQMVDAGEFANAQAAVDWFKTQSELDAYKAMLAFQAEHDEFEGTDNVDYVKLVEYSLKSSLNSAIDSYEEEDTSSNTTSTATVPGGVGTEKENFYPVTGDGELNYNVYTGYRGYLLEESGAYYENEDYVEGTNTWKRRQAYNRFIQYLDNNYLIDDNEDISDIWGLNYVESEFVTLLRQRVLVNYYNSYEAELEASIDTEYVQERYNEMLMQQTAEYDASSSDFETAMSSFSDTSFILYAPATKKVGDSENENKFGFVYNILLPFSSIQSSLLSSASSARENGVIDWNGYYETRNELLAAIRSGDQRSSWFNGGEDYSFVADPEEIDFYNKNSNILFFEDNLLDTDNSQYEKLERYLGLYAYNGKAVKNEDDSYTLLPNLLSIDGLLGEFQSYLEFALGDEGDVSWNYWADGQAVEGTPDTAAGNADYYAVTDFHKEAGNDKSDIDYSKFIYAAGRVNFGEFTASDLQNEDSAYYRAMSAVNELQYAYTTDTAVLSQYVGYSIGAYTTSYIKEFEYAAQQAIREGEGSFIVCAGDYGWHLMYVTYVFDAGEIYSPLDWTKINTEGTFEYNFFNAIKDSELSSATTTLQSNILQNLYQSGSSVEVFEDRFSDLTSLTTSLNTGSNSDSSSSGSTSTT